MLLSIERKVAMPSPEGLRELAIDRFWETVPPLWGSIRSYIRAAALKDFGISVEQFHILRHVRRGTGSISELATAKNISRPAVSQAVETLVKKGMLTRVQSTRDRRFVEVALTPAGEELLDRLFKQTRKWMNELMKGLTRDELETIAKAMEALKKISTP
jgi:DNA-binding MarR family transcriptional regulator